MDEFNILQSDIDNGEEIDALAQELLNSPPNTGDYRVAISPKEPKKLSEDNTIEQCINDSIQFTDDILSQVIKNCAGDAHLDSDKIEALATLIKSKTENMKLLNDQLNKRRDNETKIKVKQIDKQGDLLNTAVKNGNSIVSSRDELFKEVFKEDEKEKVESDKNTEDNSVIGH